MNVFLITMGLIGIAILAIVLKLRKMPQYRISQEKTQSGQDKWFVKVRKGLSYYYLEQTHDYPGFEDDVFATSKLQSGGQDTMSLAEGVIINHRMTTVSGIEIEGE